MKFPRKLLPWLIPLAATWAAHHERIILGKGVPLSAQGLLDAARMGVTSPEKIRLLEVERIPLFNGWLMKCLARLVPAVSASTVGLTLRYGIYIRAKYAGDRHLIAHECVHTGQYERLGSIRGFLLEYFIGCIEVGYPEAPLEMEATVRSAGL